MIIDARLTDWDLEDKATRIERMRKIMDAIELDETCPFPWAGTSWLYLGYDSVREPEDMAGDEWEAYQARARKLRLTHLLRALRRAGFATKKHPPNQWGERPYDLEQNGRWVGQISTPADLTCERVEVGTKTQEVEVREVVRTETKEVPVYEWRCGSTLGE